MSQFNIRILEYGAQDSEIIVYFVNHYLLEGHTVFLTKPIVNFNEMWKYEWFSHSKESLSKHKQYIGNEIEPERPINYDK